MYIAPDTKTFDHVALSGLELIQLALTKWAGRIGPDIRVKMGCFNVEEPQENQLLLSGSARIGKNQIVHFRMNVPKDPLQADMGEIKLYRALEISLQDSECKGVLNFFHYVCAEEVHNRGWVLKDSNIRGATAMIEKMREQLFS